VPDGTRLVAGTSDGSVQSWRVADGIQLMVLKAHDFGVTALDVAPDGRTGAWASIDETVQLWDLSAANHSNQLMKAFLAAVLAAILIAIGSAFALDLLDRALPTSIAPHRATCDSERTSVAQATGSG
jgi:WD40 repeat protein